MKPGSGEVDSMENSLMTLKYHVSPTDFTRAGEASSDVKHKLKKLGVPPEIVRKVAIAMYEGEINMVIHANGGEITVNITPDLIHMELRDVKHKLKKLGVPPEIVRKVAIAMYEGEINMVIHANGGEITVNITPDLIHMELRDVGPGIEDIDKAMQAGYSTAPDQVRSLGFGAGMGLPNMKKYSDTMDIQTVLGQGTTVTMTVNMPE